MQAEPHRRRAARRRAIPATPRAPEPARDTASIAAMQEESQPRHRRSRGLRSGESRGRALGTMAPVTPRLLPTACDRAAGLQLRHVDARQAAA